MSADNNDFEKVTPNHGTNAAPKVESGAQGTSPYLIGSELAEAANVALFLGRPLLLTGEPGTGKSSLACAIADQLKSPLVQEYHCKSSSDGASLLYEFDHLGRLHDVHLAAQPGVAASPSGSEGDGKPDLTRYVQYRALGTAIKNSDERRKSSGDSRQPREVVLIDEIDKAPSDFANDLLNEIDRCEFTVRETGETFKAPEDCRPVVIVTSNSERQLPRPFLRRCVVRPAWAPPSG